MIKDRVKDSLKNFTIEFKNFGQLCREKRLDSHSAAAAFFIFLSIIPVIVLILSIIPYTPITNDYFLRVLSFILPDEMNYFTKNLFEQLSDSSFTIMSVSAVTAVWTASRSVLTIKRGLNDVNECADNEENILVLRLKSILQMLVFLLAMLGILAINMVLSAFEIFFKNFLNISISEEFEFVRIVYLLKPIFVASISFIAILYLFVVLPSKKTPIKYQAPGAAITAIFWYFFSSLFSLYITNFNAYSMYGSLTAIIINLVWLYTCMYFMFLGAEFNYYLSLKRENCKI